VLTREHLTIKKPGTGIPAPRLQEMVGRRLRQPVFANQLFSEDDLEG